MSTLNIKLFFHCKHYVLDVVTRVYKESKLQTQLALKEAHMNTFLHEFSLQRYQIKNLIFVPSYQDAVFHTGVTPKY